MNRRTFLLGGVTAAAGGSALLGSGAFSETDSQRRVTIETVGDEDALLQLMYGNRSVECAETVDLIEITNHFDDAITEVNVSYEQDQTDTSISNLDSPDSLAVGERGTATVDVTCEEGSNRTSTVAISVDVESEENSVEAIHREIEITCQCPDTEEESDSEAGDSDTEEEDSGAEEDDSEIGEGESDSEVEDSDVEQSDSETEQKSVAGGSGTGV